jgi:hypothetical protein
VPRFEATGFKSECTEIQISFLTSTWKSTFYVQMHVFVCDWFPEPVVTNENRNKIKEKCPVFLLFLWYVFSGRRRNSCCACNRIRVSSYVSCVIFWQMISKINQSKWLSSWLFLLPNLCLSGVQICFLFEKCHNLFLAPRPQPWQGIFLSLIFV